MAYKKSYKAIKKLLNLKWEIDELETLFKASL